MEAPKRRLAILGSTGSIGTQTLDIVSRHPDSFQVELLTANTNSEKLIEQAIKFRPNSVVICDSSRYDMVQSALTAFDIKVFAGPESICDIVRGENIDIVVAAMVGFSGLKPAIAALESSKIVALANKETLVAAGSYITSLSRRCNAAIIPVDSEHSAIFQCLNGECSPIEKILLTGSGGPFRTMSADEIYNASPSAALNHPRWKMGSKVTIDSASLMNKGLEAIEAKWLFDVDPDLIEVVIHPQSIIHSMVQFRDGAVMASLSEPDMRIPIQYAISYPQRPALPTKRINWSELAQLTFYKPDLERFPCLRIAFDAMRKGGNAACAMNAANEAAVASFLKGRIKFGMIPEIIEKTMNSVGFDSSADIDVIFETNSAAYTMAEQYIDTISLT